MPLENFAVSLEMAHVPFSWGGRLQPEANPGKVLGSETSSLAVPALSLHRSA
jgi:hypothetical protein